MRRTVDFHHVDPEHRAIHIRLLNWERWVRPGSGSQVHPMFRQAKSNAWQWHQPEIRETVDQLDAMKVEKAVCSLPEKERLAIKWAYVIRCVPGRARQALGVSDTGLMDLIRSGRSLLLTNLNQ